MNRNATSNASAIAGFLGQHRANVVGAEVLVIECHLLEKAQYGPQPIVDRRADVVIEDLLCKVVVVKSGRRDRGVGVRSKGAGVEARDERREQLALAD